MLKLNERKACSHASRRTLLSQVPVSESRSDLALDNAENSATTHLNVALQLYAAIEFFAVGCSAYAGSTLYHLTTFKVWQWGIGYIAAAGIIATSVLLVSVCFHNFSAFQRQSQHFFLWRGLGAVALSFSAFLTMLFFTQSAEAYSRGSLIISNDQRQYCHPQYTHTFLLLASERNHVESN